MKAKTISTLIATTLLFVACKKEIKMNLKEKDVKIVIEGGISNNGKPAEIMISKTTNFNNSNDFPRVSGADVTLSDNAGHSEKLTEESSGTYKGNSLVGVAGRTYYLKVVANDKNYTAISTMPQMVSMDTLFGKSETMMGIAFFNVYPIFKDPAGVKNYYRILEFKNEVRSPGSGVIDDVYFDGNYNVQPLSNEMDDLKEGDKIEIELQCIDANIHRYFTSMPNASMGSTAPANPVSNIEGGALGYFSAHTTQKKSVIVIK